MGKKINKRETTSMLNEMNQQINEIMEDSTAIQDLIDGFIDDCGKGGLEGDGFEAAKNYFSSTYKDLLRLLNYMGVVIASQNKNLTAGIGEYITLTKYENMRQQKLREDVKNLRDEVERLNGLMEKGNRTLNTTLWADTDSRNSFYISGYESQIRELEKQIEDMDSLEADTSAFYTGIEAVLGEITRAIDTLSTGKYFDSKTGMFKTPDLQLSEVKEILETTLKTKNNIEALDPVNMVTGNYMYRKNFLETKGIAPLSLEITYNSCDNFKRKFASAGWTHNFRNELTIYKSKIVLNTDSGRQETYIKEEGGYQNTDGNKDRRFIELTTGDYAYQYINEKLETLYFDDRGRCLEKITANGRSIRFEYDDMLLKKLYTEFGTGYLFDYDVADDGTAYTTKISDFSGRAVNFNYTDIADEFSGTGRSRVLTEIQDEMGESYSFKYNEACKMYMVTNARNTVNLINEYDVGGRVKKQIFPDGGKITIDYFDASRKVIATHQNGSKTTYEHDKKFRSTVTSTETGREETTYTDSNDKSSFSDGNGNVTSYKYDAFGDVVFEETPAGDVFETVYLEEGKPLKASLNGVVLFENNYDEHGNLVSSTDAIGRNTEFQYNEYNLPVKICNPDGTALSLKYDERANLSEHIDELGNVSKYKYDDLNRLISSTDENGNSSEFKYNARNEIIESIDSLGQKRVFEYNESGKPVRVVDYDGYEELLSYNELNKISAYVDKDGGKTEYSYNKMWQIEKIVDPTGAKTLYTYDSAGNLVKITDATFASISYSYDACGNMIKERDQEGNVTKYEYDAMNRPVKLIMQDGSTEHYEYDAFGNEIKFIDALGGEWASEYDPAGQKIKDIDPEGVETEFDYDLRGNLIEIRTLNQSVKYSYDAAGRLIELKEASGAKSEYSYDGAGNLTKVLTAGVERTYEYDCLSRITKEFTAGVLTASYEYDAVGNIISACDGAGNRTRYVRSKAGQVIAVIDPLGNVTRYRYDKAHRLMNVVQGEGEEAASVDMTLLDKVEELMKINRENNSLRIISYERDILGRETSVTDALGNRELYEYDKRGFVKAKTDMDGNRTEISRNHHGDISRISYAGGEILEYKYDPLRRLKEIKDSLGITKIERDRLGRETKISDHKGRTVSYGYDAFGNRTSIRYANGRDIRYMYNEAGLLTEIDCGDKKALLSYDGNGRVSSKKIGSAETRYTYNVFGSLASLVNTDSGNVLDSYEYGYDDAGNLTSSRQVREGLPIATGLFEYGYDAAGRLNTVAKDGSIIRDYSYDAFGNRTSLSENGSKTVYEYNKANQLLNVESPDGETSFEYDKRGNLVRKNTSKGLLVDYIYGPGNRLLKATKTFDGKAETASYKYNGLGMRVSRTTDAGSVDYILDQTKMYNNLIEKAGEDYVWLGNELLMAGGEPTLTGRLLTVERAHMENTHDAVFGAFAYDEFGLPSTGAEAAGITAEHGFTGYIYDDITDSYFAQAREYIPEIGRFAGRDILKGNVENPRSLNEYAYCHNNPVGFVDFNGMLEKDILDNVVLYDFKKHEPQSRKDIAKEYGRNTAVDNIDTGAKHVKATADYNTETNRVTTEYSKEYGAARKEAIKVRQETGNPWARNGTLSWITRRKNNKLDDLKYERDLAYGRIRVVTPSNLAKVGVKGGIIGAFVDTGFGIYDDYSAGSSDSKMWSNAGINFTFGAAEGAIIGGATLVFGPAGFAISTGIVLLVELFSGARDKAKNSANSLD